MGVSDIIDASKTSDNAGERGVVIRAGAPTDASAIAHIGSSTFAACFGYSLPAVDLQAYLDTAYPIATIREELHDPRYTFLVACDASDPSEVLGFVQLTVGTSEPCTEDLPNPIELQRIYVSQTSHRGGVGKLLVERAEEVARARGFQTLWLGVWEDNPAQKFYVKMGMQKIGSHDFVMGKTTQTDFIFVKAL